MKPSCAVRRLLFVLPGRATAPAPTLTQGITRQPERVVSPDGIQHWRAPMGRL